MRDIADDNADCGRKGQLVGFPEDELPILIQLEGRQNNTEFWAQKEALDLLQDQMLAAISDGLPAPPVQVTLPPREPAQRKPSLFGRKASKAPEVKQPPRPPPVTVQAQLDEVYFRTETEYGLLETLRRRAIVVTVEVR